jgi:peptidoglycan/LPS O-acetylase OafA/YrhL
MTAEYAKFRKVRFFASLDGLRALSIVAVIWLHCWWGTPYYPRLAKIPVLRQGGYGVHIFFVISGFLITTLLLRERDRFGKISIRDFYTRRALRIWPLYYATIALYIPVMWLAQSEWRSRNFFHYLPYFLTYTYTWFMSPKWNAGTFNLAWTLCTEEQFYAVWPIVLRFVRGWWSSAVIVGVVALRIAAGHGWTNSFLPPGWLPTRIVLSISVAICFGVLLAQALHSERGFRWLNYVLGRKWSAPAALVAVALCLAPQRVSLLSAFVATTALVGACVVREDNGLARALRLRPIAYIGVLSYGMYLFNSLSVHAVEVVLGRIGLFNPLFVFPFGVGLATGAAFLSYRYFESRFLALKSRFSRLRPAPSESAADGLIDAQTGVQVHP